MANLTAIVRRHNGHSDSIITSGSIAINLSTRTVSVAGEKVDLTGKEVQILELLALRKGATISKTQLINHLYNGRDEPELKIIDVFVCNCARNWLIMLMGKTLSILYGVRAMPCVIILCLLINT
ncbi:MAG: winged helix-turn-helix domain-containing protein [Candidatus Puniceispirillales bacterium]